MTLRPEMVGLKELVCRLVDPAGALELDADVVQDHLDRHATRVLGHPLRTEGHPITGAVLAHTGPDWLADDAVVIDQAGTAVTPTGTADPVRGRWTWAATSPGPYYVDGTRYNVLAAAAELAETLAVQASRGIVSYTDAAGESFTRGDASAGFRELAAGFRRAMPVGSVPIGQAEAAGNRWPV